MDLKEATREEARMTPRFLSRGTGRIELPLTKLRRPAELAGGKSGNLF